jgi:protein-S-isoprenylcysteine O-methyltransferase Ste14
MRSVVAFAVRASAHAALLAVPAVALGRTSFLARPQAIACVLAMLLFAEVEAASRSAPDPSGPRAPGSRLALASALGLLATAWSAIAAPAFAPGLATWLGVPMIAAGIVLRALAMRALGASFTSEIVAAPGHALVTDGIYARMRHPSDIGLLLVALGLVILGGSLTAAAILILVVAPSVFARTIREDRVLAARHSR